MISIYKIFIWITFSLKVLGTFLISVLLCFLVLFPKGTDFSQLFQMAATGSVCAFFVVFVAYFSAPKHKIITAVVCFGIGTIVAWSLLKDIDYAVTTHYLAVGEKSVIPFLATMFGGSISLVVFKLAGFFSKKRPKKFKNEYTSRVGTDAA